MLIVINEVLIAKHHLESATSRYTYKNVKNAVENRGVYPQKTVSIAASTNPFKELLDWDDLSELYRIELWRLDILFSYHPVIGHKYPVKGVVPWPR